MDDTSFLRRFSALFAVLVLAGSVSSQAQTVRPRTATRIFWQDAETQRLSCADIVATKKWNLNRGQIRGLPTLESQQLQQMKAVDGVLMVAVSHDASHDASRSGGWIAVDTGVFERPHGSHKHWMYTGKPTVSRIQLDREQGNPRRIHVHDQQIFVVNEGRSGFTRTLPSLIRKSSDVASKNARQTLSSATKVFPGGGTNASLTTISDTVGYVSWGDDTGENAGRVDVVNLKTGLIAYALKVPARTIHSVTANSGKVFISTDREIYWTTADRGLTGSEKTSSISVVSNPAKVTPIVTQFASDRNWVMFTAGSGGSASMNLINAAAVRPQIIVRPVATENGLRLTPPSTVLSLGKRYAVFFQQKVDPANTVKEQLVVMELDPNRDRDFRDARMRKRQPVGASVPGVNHGISFDAYGQYAVFSEPADGIMNLMTLKDLRLVARFRVGGRPGRVTAVGAPEHFH